MRRVVERNIRMKSRLWMAVFALLLAACDQNVERVSTGERLEDVPSRRVEPSAVPSPSTASALPAARMGAEDLEAQGMRGKVPPFVKVYFMHQFVEALYSVPKNSQPNPNWRSPLKDPENGRVWCTDCHGDKFDFTKMPKQKMPQNDELEKDHEFMVELMTKWVGRLNSDEFGAKAKLKEAVQCTTCHAKDPREN